MCILAAPISSIPCELTIVQLNPSLVLHKLTQSLIIFKRVAIEPHHLEIQVLYLADKFSHIFKLVVDKGKSDNGLGKFNIAQLQKIHIVKLGLNSFFQGLHSQICL